MTDATLQAKAMLRRKTLALGPALLILSALSSRAATSGASFLMIPSSPRAYSLGQTQAVSALGAQAVGANPANMGLMTQNDEIFTSYASGIGGAQYGHVAAAFSTPGLGPVDGLGAAATRLQIGGFQGTDGSGNFTGSTFGLSDTALAFAASGRLTSDLRLGLAVKGVQSQISGYRSNWALAGDIGLTYTFTQFAQPVSVGFSVVDFGQGLKFVEQTDPLPTSLNAGVAAPLGPVTAVLEVNRWVSNQITEVGMGVEYSEGPVSYRAGYLAQDNPQQNLALKDQKGLTQALGGLTFGLGIQAGPVRLDYAAAQQAADYGFTQRVGLTIRWGGAKDKLVTMRASDARRRRESARDSSEWLIPGDYGIMVR